MNKPKHDRQTLHGVIFMIIFVAFLWWGFLRVIYQIGRAFSPGLS